MQSKKCKDCSIEKSLESFWNTKSGHLKKSCRCIVCDKEKNKRSYLRHKEKRKQEARDYYNANTKSCLKRSKEWALRNKEYLSAYNKKWLSDNPNYYGKKYRSEPLEAIRRRAKSRIHGAFRRHGLSKKSTTLDMIGCSWEEFCRHIERQFLKGMSWDNRSKWHIDHIVPLSSAKTETEVISLCHHTNMQPLWAKDNQSKSGKITHML